MWKIICALIILLIVLNCSFAYAGNEVSVVYKDGSEKIFKSVRKVIEVYDDFGNLQQIRIVTIAPRREIILNYRNLTSYSPGTFVEVEQVGFGREGRTHGPIQTNEEFKEWKEEIIKKSK